MIKNDMERKCLHCNGIFIATRYQVKKGRARFCSLQCYGKSIYIERIEIKCKHCHKLFISHKNGSRKYCSQSCSTSVRNKLIALPTEDIFWRNIVPPKHKNDCWLYKSVQRCKSSGYGMIYINQRYYSAHRFSWELYNGRIPKGKFCLHRCDIRNCVNPDHLFLGTNKDNMRDKVKKGRANVPYGEKHHGSIINDNIAKKIKLNIKKGISAPEIAKNFNISKGIVFAIKSGKCWKHVQL